MVDLSIVMLVYQRVYCVQRILITFHTCSSCPKSGFLGFPISPFSPFLEAGGHGQARTKEEQDEDQRGRGWTWSYLCVYVHVNGTWQMSVFRSSTSH